MSHEALVQPEGPSPISKNLGFNQVAEGCKASGCPNHSAGWKDTGIANPIWPKQESIAAGIRLQSLWQKKITEIRRAFAGRPPWVSWPLNNN